MAFLWWKRLDKQMSNHNRRSRQRVAQLCQAVRGLTTLQAVMDRKLDAALKGGVGADFAVL
jgi:hypothetical protein